MFEGSVVRGLICITRGDWTRWQDICGCIHSLVKVVISFSPITAEDQLSMYQCVDLRIHLPKGKLAETLMKSQYHRVNQDNLQEKGRKLDASVDGWTDDNQVCHLTCIHMSGKGK